MQLPVAASAWQTYYGKEFPSFTPTPEWTPKHHAVDELLTELAPETVLDVGSNSGWYAQLASRKGARVVAFDTDESAVDQLYGAARRDGQSILPLVMSFTNPTPGYGVNNSLSSSAAERFRCDVVLALALTHHLVFTGNLRFDHIAAGLAALTGRTLIVEFIPRDDEYVRHWGASRDDWYVQENFIAALSVHFPRVTVRPSHPSPRVIMVCGR
jgi:SAM-dependent methyltransferase